MRNEVLCRPWGFELSDERLIGEESQFQFGIFDQQKIVACVLFMPISMDTLKLRQMSVSLRYQGQGLGKNLIVEAEKILKASSYTRIEMSARITALNFYKNLGYQTTGSPFIEVGLKHIKMTKHLL